LAGTSPVPIEAPPVSNKAVGKGGSLEPTQAKTRYGCFLPDLTGLARSLSGASLPRAL